MVLKLNEENQNLKLIQVNDGVIVMDLKSEISKNDWYYLPRLNDSFQSKEDPTELNLERRVGIAKIIFATPNLKLEGVPEIEQFGSKIISLAKNTADEQLKVNNELKLGFISGFCIGYKQAQQNLFTEDDVLLLVAEAIAKFKLGKFHDVEQIKESLKSIKQPKVEIEFDENNKPIKAKIING